MRLLAGKNPEPVNSAGNQVRERNQRIDNQTQLRVDERETNGKQDGDWSLQDALLRQLDHLGMKIASDQPLTVRRRSRHSLDQSRLVSPKRCPSLRQMIIRLYSTFAPSSSVLKDTPAHFSRAVIFYTSATRK